MTELQPGCVNCGHSHTFDGPLKPYKPVDTHCWLCGCDSYEPETDRPVIGREVH